MIVEKLRHAMLVALAMMALVVSVEFLHGFHALLPGGCRNTPTTP
jgi:hypothetical protein